MIEKDLYYVLYQRSNKGLIIYGKVQGLENGYQVCKIIKTHLLKIPGVKFNQEESNIYINLTPFKNPKFIIARRIKENEEHIHAHKIKKINLNCISSFH